MALAAQVPQHLENAVALEGKCQSTNLVPPEDMLRRNQNHDRQPGGKQH